MLVHEGLELVMENPIEKKPKREAKKYIVVQNHVREINSPDNSDRNKEDIIEISSPIKRDISPRLRKRRLSNAMKFIPSSESLLNRQDNEHVKVTEISCSDLVELKSVYKKCKEVIEKIETKYGHLLNITDNNKIHYSQKDSDQELEEECQCAINKKIVFNDNGEQETIDTDLQLHICPKKIKNSSIATSVSRKIEIQYNEIDIELPDDLEVLSNMLRNPKLEITYRNKIIHKFRSLKNELMNEIKFNKHTLVEKLKTNPLDLLDFKGTNLADFTGYPL